MSHRSLVWSLKLNSLTRTEVGRPGSILIPGGISSPGLSSLWRSSGKTDRGRPGRCLPRRVEKPRQKDKQCRPRGPNRGYSWIICPCSSSSEVPTKSNATRGPCKAYTRCMRMSTRARYASRASRLPSGSTRMPNGSKCTSSLRSV